MKVYKNCQSCGIPLTKDPEKGGTNTNGTKNEMYCSYCYSNGKFTRPDITATEMKTLCKMKIKEMGYPGFLASFFTMGIPKLERWKK